ncbi:MAG: DUF4276 family protein [Thermosynechococcaceae cyanobacterium]
MGEVALHIEFLVEEYSAQIVLESILPKMLSADTSFAVRSFRGKPDLLKNLPSRLRGYKYTLDYRVVVLVDRDDDDCRDLKSKLEAISKECGIVTKSIALANQSFQVLNRIAIEELEAWFFGDVDALVAAYPGVPVSLANKAKYRDPDAITGGTAEALEKVLQRAGYHRGRLEKVKAARDISLHMNPALNRSRSFQVFCEGLSCIKAV